MNVLSCNGLSLDLNQSKSISTEQPNDPNSIPLVSCCELRGVRRCSFAGVVVEKPQNQIGSLVDRLEAGGKWQERIPGLARFPETRVTGLVGGTAQHGWTRCSVTFFLPSLWGGVRGCRRVAFTQRLLACVFVSAWRGAS